ncbi:hypothetical protein V8F33_010425 [Rhypophila sp. PSN 637]
MVFYATIYTGEFPHSEPFQDAVARIRAAQGLPCGTIDLGLVTDLGYLANAGKDELSNQLETTKQFRVIQETDLHRLMDYGVREPLRPIRTSQVVTGLAGSAVRKQRIPWTWELRFGALAADDDRNQNGSSKQQRKGASAAINLPRLLLVHKTRRRRPSWLRRRYCQAVRHVRETC